MIQLKEGELLLVMLLRQYLAVPVCRSIKAWTVDITIPDVSGMIITLKRFCSLTFQEFLWV
jgi:hypothetical protein